MREREGVYIHMYDEKSGTPKLYHLVAAYVIKMSKILHMYNLETHFLTTDPRLRHLGKVESTSLQGPG